MRDHARSPDYYRYFAREAAKGGSPLYEHLSLAIAEDPALMEIAALKRAEQPPANILFASVHALLLGRLDHPLKEYYPSCGGARAVDSETFHQFKEFCTLHREKIEALVREGVTNTNEVGRSALLAPAFCQLAVEGGLPLSLIEIGPSAGLNLNFDRFTYVYRSQAGAEARYWAGGALTLVCEARGERTPLLTPAPPAVAYRVGLELNPNNLGDAARRLWLRALIWPERTDRIARLDAAIAVAERFLPPIRFGDALALLPACLGEAPANSLLIVYHTFVLYQFSAEMRAALDDLLAAEAARRPVLLVGVEGGADGINALRMTRFHGKARDVTLLAECDAHGHWIDWRGAAK